MSQNFKVKLLKSYEQNVVPNLSEEIQINPNLLEHIYVVIVQCDLCMA